MKSRCMCLSILAGGIYGHTHIQFTLGLDELLILVNTPPGSMLYNSIKYYAYWLSCLSGRVHSLAALIHVGWLWIGTYVLFPLFSLLSRIFLLVPGRKNFSLCWTIWTAFHSAHDTSVTTYVLIYRRWFVQSASRCSTCSHMWQTRCNAQCCGVYRIFLAPEAMHESCNMSVYRNKPVYTSVGFWGVCDSVKEEKFYPFPLCNLQGWLNLFIRYTFWQSVLTTLRLEFWAMPLELASA